MADLMAGKRVRRAAIVRGVYFAEGTLYHPTARDESGAPVEVDQYHYQLLGPDGDVLGHGDGYVSEEHVVLALEGLLGDYGLPFGPGKPQAIHPDDVAAGKRSASDRPSEVTT